MIIAIIIKNDDDDDDDDDNDDDDNAPASCPFLPAGEYPHPPLRRSRRRDNPQRASLGGPPAPALGQVHGQRGARLDLNRSTSGE